MFKKYTYNTGFESLYNTDSSYIVAVKHPSKGWFTDINFRSKFDTALEWGYGRGKNAIISTKTYKTEQEALEDIFLSAI